MIAGRHSMIAGKALPFDSAVEYLEGIGDQFVDTGYKTCEASNMAFDAMFTGYASSGYSSTMLFGSQTLSNGSASTALALWLNSNGQMSFNDFGFDSGWISSPTIATNSRHTFEIKNRSLFVDGTSVVASSSAAAFRATVSVCLLRANTPSGYQSGSNRRMKGRIYSFSAREGGVLLFDYTPVRVGTTGELYDRVSGTFATRVGTFGVGPDTGYQQGGVNA